MHVLKSFKDNNAHNTRTFLILTKTLDFGIYSCVKQQRDESLHVYFVVDHSAIAHQNQKLRFVGL